jgi:YHS domain-containing protein
MCFDASWAICYGSRGSTTGVIMPILHRRNVLLTAFALLSAAGIMPARAGEKIYTGLLSGSAVGGYDPVAYFKLGKPVEGKSEFVTEYEGANWYFDNAENKDAFIANPKAYAPQYGGHCAWAAAGGYLAKGDPANWKIVDGKLYLNYNAEVQAKWVADIPGFISKGDANWPKIGQN